MSRERIGVGRARSPNLVPVNTEPTSQITPRPSRSKGIVQFLRALTSHIFKTDEKPPIGYFYEEMIHDDRAQQPVERIIQPPKLKTGQASASEVAEPGFEEMPDPLELLK